MLKNTKASGIIVRFVPTLNEEYSFIDNYRQMDKNSHEVEFKIRRLFAWDF